MRVRVALLRPLTVALTAVAGSLLLITLAAPVAAGGSWFNPVADRYEPGDTATLVGYTGGGILGALDDGPFFGFLAARVDEDDYVPISPDFEPLELGELDITRTTHGGYLSYRAAVTFELPGDLEPGVYRFDYCNEACDKQLGDLIGGFVWVGVDPNYTITRYWAPDEPELANLAPGQVISGPALNSTAPQARITPDLTPPAKVSTLPSPAASSKGSEPPGDAQLAVANDRVGLVAPNASDGAGSLQLDRGPGVGEERPTWLVGSGVAALVAAALWRRRPKPSA